MDVDLDGLGGPILAPGLGAQGGSVADLRRLFGTGRAVVPTVSRDVLARRARPGRAAGGRRPLDGGAGRMPASADLRRPACRDGVSRLPDRQKLEIVSETDPFAIAL